MPKRKNENEQPKKMGRPRKEINKVEFEKLCKLQCTEVEICAWFDTTDKTLTAWCRDNYFDENGNGLTFSEVYKQKREHGKIALRRAQMQLATKNATMAIFLGKQILGQKDYSNIDINANINPYQNLTEEELKNLANGQK